MPQGHQGDATTTFQASRSAEMGNGEPLQSAASTTQSLDGRAIATKEPGNYKLRNKQSLDYVLRTGLAGGLAGCAAKTMVAPLDRVKILFQASNPQFAKYAGSWFGVVIAMRDINRQDGVRGLFRGHSATLIKVFPYAAIKFLAYEQFRAAIIRSPAQETPLRRLSSGSLAGLSSVFITYPLEVIRVRLAFETRLDSRSSLSSICTQIYHERPPTSAATISLPGAASTPVTTSHSGLVNFYRGFSPTIAGMIPYAGMSFLTHDTAGDWLRSPALAPHTTTTSPASGRPILKYWAELLTGGFAGLVSQTAAYPLEVIRRRMQVGGAVGDGHRLGIAETTKNIWMEKGWRGFFVGLTIGYMKVVPMVAVSFYVYERRAIGLGRSGQRSNDAGESPRMKESRSMDIMHTIAIVAVELVGPGPPYKSWVRTRSKIYAFANRSTIQKAPIAIFYHPQPIYRLQDLVACKQLTFGLFSQSEPRQTPPPQQPPALLASPRKSIFKPLHALQSSHHNGMSLLTRLRPLTSSTHRRPPTHPLPLPTTYFQSPTPRTPPPLRSMSSSPLPPTMRGIQISRTGGPEVLTHLTTLPLPVPRPGEILIKNSIIGINYIDTYFRTGLYPSPLPSILGREAAGTVVSSAEGFTAGEKVVWLGTGGYAEYTAAPAAKTLRIPEGISEREACAAILQGLTALTLVEEAHRVERGEWVLVLAATGGVGGWLLQMLRAKGARTIACVGSGGKVEEARRLGAEVVVVEGEVERVVGERTGGEGVRVVFDGVGRKTFERSLGVVGRKGSVVSFGNASGAVEPFSIAKLSAKNVKVMRPTLFNYIYTREEYEKYAGELWRLMIDEKFDVRVHKTYALKDVAQAQQDLESRNTMGKLLMTP